MKSTFVKNKILYSLAILLWTGICFIASQFIVYVPMALILKSDVTKPFWTLIYYILNYSLALFLILVLPGKLYKVIKHKKLSGDEPLSATLGVDSYPTLADLGLAPIGYIIYAIVAGFITNILSNFSWYDAEQAQDVGFGYFITGSDRVIAIIAIVFIAPLAEELIMRGWAYGKLRNRLSFPVAALLISLLFGLLHGQLNVGVATFILSLVLCSLREITGSIWSGVILHIITNGIAFYILYIAI